MELSRSPPSFDIEGHAGKVSGLIALADKRLLSWSGDVESANTTLQLWDNQNGKCLRVLAGHTERVGGALELADGRLLSWSGLTLRVWDGRNGCSPCYSRRTQGISSWCS